jgi:hypothetical protein
VSLQPRQQLRLTRELARIETDFDYMLVDTAAGIEETTLNFISAANHTLVVITPEPTSLTDAFSLIKLLHRKRRKIDYQVVVNMVGSIAESKAVFHRFTAAVEKYIGPKPHYLGCIPKDESLRAAVALQNPVALFAESDPSCRHFLRLADSLRQAIDEHPVATSFSAYWLRQCRQAALAVATGNTVKAVPSRGDSDEHYLQELRARLLLLMDKPAEPQAMAELINSLVSAFSQQFGHSPVDILQLLDQLLAVDDRDDQLLRTIYQRVKPWGAEPPVEKKPCFKPESVLVAAGETPADNKPHSYDQQRFGSQQQLLQRLRSAELGEELSLQQWLSHYG